jgi:hypothetical protein
MALPMPFGHGAAHPLENAAGCDFHCYARQSSALSHGNANTGVQEEDLPRAVATRFGIADMDAHECFRRYETEVESGSDGSTRLVRDVSGNLTLANFDRSGLLDIFDTIKERWTRYRRPAVLAVSMLNRLGRSDWTLPFLASTATECEGNLYVYVASTGALLDLSNPSDQQQLVIEFSFSGKGENRTKSHAVKAARKRIGAQPCSGTRSLGEKPFGYDKFFCDYDGSAIENPLEWTQKRGKQPPKAFRKSPDAEVIVQRIYDYCTVERLSAGRIAALVQLEFGNHPEHARMWSRYHVERILANPIYRGQRVTNRSTSLSLGNKRRRRSKPDEVVTSPHDEALRMISDEQWHLALEVLNELNASEQGGSEKHNAKKGKAGRPLNMDLLLHRTGLLRCALCGVSMKANKLEPNYYYRCSHRAESFGQIRCQSHDAQVIDRAIADAVRSLFQEVKNFAGELRKEIKELRAQGKLNLVEKQLATAKEQLESLETALMLATVDLQRGKIDQSRYDRQRAIVDKKADEARSLEERRNGFGSDSVVKAKEARLQQLEGMETFDRVPFARKKALLSEIFTAVWLWPDGKFEFQWKGQSEADMVERGGRPLRIAQEWPVLDFGRVLQDTYAIMERTEMPFLILDGGVISGSLRHSFAQMKKRGKEASPRYHLPIFKGFVRARAAYLDVPALRADLLAFYGEWLATGKSLSELERTTGISYKTWQRMHAGQPSKWALFAEHLAAMVTNLGWDAAKYTTVPADIFSHPKLDEMTLWLMAEGADDEGQSPAITGDPEGSGPAGDFGEIASTGSMSPCSTRSIVSSATSP